MRTTTVQTPTRFRVVVGHRNKLRIAAEEKRMVAAAPWSTNELDGAPVVDVVGGLFSFVFQSTSRRRFTIYSLYLLRRRYIYIRLLFFFAKKNKTIDRDSVKTSFPQICKGRTEIFLNFSCGE